MVKEGQRNRSVLRAISSVCQEGPVPGGRESKHEKERRASCRRTKGAAAKFWSKSWIGPGETLCLREILIQGGSVVPEPGLGEENPEKMLGIGFIRQENHQCLVTTSQKWRTKHDSVTLEKMLLRRLHGANYARSLGMSYPSLGAIAAHDFNRKSHPSPVINYQHQLST